MPTWSHTPVSIVDDVAALEARMIAEVQEEYGAAAADAFNRYWYPNSYVIPDPQPKSFITLKPQREEQWYDVYYPD